MRGDIYNCPGAKMRREMGQVFKDGFTNMEFRLEKEDVCYDINFIVQYMIFDTVFCEERNKKIYMSKKKKKGLVQI